MNGQMTYCMHLYSWEMHSKCFENAKIWLFLNLVSFLTHYFGTITKRWFENVFFSWLSVVSCSHVGHVTTIFSDMFLFLITVLHTKDIFISVSLNLVPEAEPDPTGSLSAELHLTVISVSYGTSCGSWMSPGRRHRPSDLCGAPAGV